MLPTNIKGLDNFYEKIDHIAIAVHNLDKAIRLYGDLFGFTLVERRETRGSYSGMISAVMSANNFTFVLVQGTEPESQVSRYIDEYGPGVQHVALEVRNLDTAVAILEESGIKFSTNKITGSGLYQIFSQRDPNSGVMIELIERHENLGFDEESVLNLFNQLETSGEF